MDSAQDTQNSSPIALDLKREQDLVDDLKEATVMLRDAELAQRRAQERYRAALGAFNRHVAPVEA
jgi:hypothetical protein